MAVDQLSVQRPPFYHKHTLLVCTYNDTNLIVHCGLLFTTLHVNIEFPSIRIDRAKSPNQRVSQATFELKVIFFPNLSRTHTYKTVKQPQSSAESFLTGARIHLQKPQKPTGCRWVSLGEGTEATSKKLKKKEKLREVERLGATSTDRVVQCLVFTEGRCESV